MEALIRDGGVWSSTNAYYHRRSGGYEQMIRTPAMPSWLVFIVSGRTIHEVDLRTRKVRLVLETESPILGFHHAVRTENDGRDVHTSLLVRTADRVQVLSGKRDLIGACTLPDELRGEGFLWYDIGNGRALVIHSNERDVPTADVDHTLYWLTLDGGVAETRKITLTRYRREDGTTSPDEALTLLFAPVALPTPIPWLLLGITMHALSLVGLKKAPTFAAGLGEGFAEYGIYLIAAVVLCTILAAWSCRREKRLGSSRLQRCGWTAFVFIGGFPAMMGYLLQRRRPVMEACPACHKKVPRNEERCVACAAPFPEPARKGIEVFA